MWGAHCISCDGTLNQVIIPPRSKRHVIRSHYRRAANGKSLFFPLVMPSHVLFTTIINELRSGLQASYSQEVLIEGQRIVRHIYYYRCGFAVGVCRNRQGARRLRQTDTIKIVCNTTECQACNRRWARDVVTAYPC